MKRILFPYIAFLLLLPLSASAQVDTVVSASDDIIVTGVPSSVRPMHPLTDKSKLVDDTLQRWEFHLSMGSSIVGTSFSSASLFGITPSIIYRPNDRLKIKASMTALDSYTIATNGYRIRGNEPRSLAPVRYPGSTAGAFNVSASYRVNDRLWIAASLMHVIGGLAAGTLLNPWFVNDSPVPLDATAFSAAMRYRIGEDNYIDIHMSFIDDRTGAMLPFMFGTPFSPVRSFSTDGWFHIYDPVFDSKW